jgi:PII-like signaling protein
MNTEYQAGDSILLRIFIDKFQRHHLTAVYVQIVELALKRGLSGAVVLEGVEGFGQSGKIMQERIWFSSNQEVIVEIIDEYTKIRSFLDSIEPMLSNALVTLERARVLRFNSKPGEI